MNNDNKDIITKVLILIPLFMLIVALVIEAILEVTHNNIISDNNRYYIFIKLYKYIKIISVFPGVIPSIIGTIRAARSHMTKYTVFGILQLLYDAYLIIVFTIAYLGE